MTNKNAKVYVIIDESSTTTIISFIDVAELTSSTAENMFSWAALAVWKACTVLQVHFVKHEKLSGMTKGWKILIYQMIKL
jgi:hypothetical protein